MNCGNDGRVGSRGLGGVRKGGGAEWGQQGDNWTLKLFSCLVCFTDTDKDTEVWTGWLIIICY